MSKFEKELRKLMYKPKDLRYDEIKYILNKLGFYENNKGKTSGSRVEFKNKYGVKLMFHKPHKDGIVKTYVIKNIIEKLKEDYIDE